MGSTPTRAPRRSRARSARGGCASVVAPAALATTRCASAPWPEVKLGGGRRRPRPPPLKATPGWLREILRPNRLRSRCRPWTGARAGRSASWLWRQSLAPRGSRRR
eukprot:88487-Alexandrium_andersonii.AAC.1